MALKYYRELPWNISTRLGPVDTYTGGGGVSTFTLVKKTANDLASTVQADSTLYYQYTGGLTKNTVNNTFTLSSAPPNGSQIVAPAIGALVANAFDQDTVSGVTNPRVAEVPFWIGDIDEIHLYKYTNLPQNTGIKVSIVDLVSGAGASISWCQLACSNANGVALTYAATGDPLYMRAIQTFGTISASTLAGTTVIPTTQASSFVAGDYIMINIGNSTQEHRQIFTVQASGSLTLATATDFVHQSGETLFQNGYKCFLKVTVPTNAANNTATSLWDIGLKREGKIISRL